MSKPKQQQVDIYGQAVPEPPEPRIDITRRPITATLHCHHCGDIVTAAYELSNAVKFQKQLAAGDLTCGVCGYPLQATPRRIILITDDEAAAYGGAVGGAKTEMFKKIAT